MNCLYCHKEIKRLNLKSAFLKEDQLCSKCRERLIPNRRVLDVEGIDVEVFFSYDSFFKDLLIQYKECMDEALKNVFLYDIEEYINIRYFGYQMLLVPSSKKAIKERGFNHLEGIFENVKLKRVKGLIMKEELSQKGQNKTNRLAMRNNYDYYGENIEKLLIVDDVITTGSSIIGVYNIMKGHSKKIKVLVLAN